MLYTPGEKNPKAQLKDLKNIFILKNYP